MNTYKTTLFQAERDYYYYVYFSFKYCHLINQSIDWTPLCLCCRHATIHPAASFEWNPSWDFMRRLLHWQSATSIVLDSVISPSLVRLYRWPDLCVTNRLSRLSLSLPTFFKWWDLHYAIHKYYIAMLSIFSQFPRGGELNRPTEREFPLEESNI